MTGKNITKRILYCVLLAIAVSLMFFYVRNEYKTYTDSKVVKADANYAQTECQFRYCGTAIPFLTVRSTAR